MDGRPMRPLRDRILGPGDDVDIRPGEPPDVHRRGVRPLGPQGRGPDADLHAAFRRERRALAPASATAATTRSISAAESVLYVGSMIPCDPSRSVTGRC